MGYTVYLLVMCGIVSKEDPLINVVPLINYSKSKTVLMSSAIVCKSLTCFVLSVVFGSGSARTAAQSSVTLPSSKSNSVQ